MWQKLNRSYPLQFELVPLLLLLLTVYLALSSYPSLPDRVPTHFNLEGVPDGWGSKSEILVVPILSAVFYVVFTVIAVLMATTKDPRKLINLPAGMKRAMSSAQAENLRVMLNRSLFALKVLILGLLAYSVYITVEVALGRANGLGVPWFFLIAGILAVAGYMVWQSFRIALAPGRGQGDDYSAGVGRPK